MFFQEPCVISTHTGCITQPITVTVPARGSDQTLFHFDQFNTAALNLAHDTAEPWQVSRELFAIKKPSLDVISPFSSPREQDHTVTSQSCSPKQETHFRIEGNNLCSHFDQNCDETKPKQRSSKSSRKILSPNSPECQRRRRKANEREKQRIVVLKQALGVLKNCIPTARRKPKMTKLEILNQAREYINSLKLQLDDKDGMEQGKAEITTSEMERDLFIYCNYDSC